MGILRVRGWRLQWHRDTAREDRREHGIAKCCREKDVGSGGRLLQGFQESICRLRLQAVGIVDHCNLVVARERLHVKGLLEFADLVRNDAPGLRLRRGDMEIRV